MFAVTDLQLLDGVQIAFFTVISAEISLVWSTVYDLSRYNVFMRTAVMGSSILV